MPRELLHRFAAVVQVDLVFEDANGALTAYFDSIDDSPLMRDPSLRRELREGASAQGNPYSMRDDFNAYYIAQPYRDGWLFLGPMFNSRLNPLESSAYYRRHQIQPEHARKLRDFTLRQIKDISVLASSMLRGNIVKEEDFRVENPVPIASDHKIQQELSKSAGADESSLESGEYKHSYREEQRLLQAAQEGRVEDVVRISEKMDADSGRFSHHDLNHWRTLAVIGITLISRAAILGGVPVESAYRVSGYYIGKCVSATERGAVLHYRNRAIEDLVGRVAKLKSKPQGSGYTARCKDYIQKHFREKIYIEDIAEPLGISAGYLSKVFKRETGYSVQEYINQVRVERAANLLIYSDKSLPAIAEYVHFPTQSYFGKIFKQVKGVTPNEYRRENMVHEYREE